MPPTLLSRLQNCWNIYLISSVGLALYMKLSWSYLLDEHKMDQLFTSTPRALVMLNIGYLSSYILVMMALHHTIGQLSKGEIQYVRITFLQAIGLHGLLVLIVARPGRITEAFFWLHFTKGVATCVVLVSECERAFRRISQQQGVVYPSEHKLLLVLLVIIHGVITQLQNFYTFKLSRASLRVVWLISSWCVMCKFRVFSLLVKFAIHSLNEDSPTPLRDSQIAATSLLFAVLKMLFNLVAFSHVLWRFNGRMNSVSLFILMQMIHSTKELMTMLNDVFTVIKRVNLLKKL